MFYNGAEAEFEIKRLQDCCQSYRAEIERLRTALKELAKQKLPREMTAENRTNADYEGAYCTMISLARTALAGTDPAMPARQGDGGADKTGTGWVRDYAVKCAVKEKAMRDLPRTHGC